jgi:hypothetical protein
MQQKVLHDAILNMDDFIVDEDEVPLRSKKV